MDYVEMLKDPELILGIQELIQDSEPVVVKRTVKVFTSVYYHALRLLSAGELEEAVFLSSWSSVKGVVDTIMKMVSSCENEGVLIHLLRFLEAAVTSHLMHDLTPYPEVFEKGRDVVKSGLRTLKNLVITPYVGGSSYIVGIRALITIACLRRDLWEPVTDLLKKQIASLPPTLFDHNVRSLHKTLQRNLFRLLRRADNPVMKEKLIEMMVAVGVPRKNVLPWAPPAGETKKRPANGNFSEENIVGRVSPPQKKRKTGDGRDDNSPASSRSTTPDLPKDPRIKEPIASVDVTQSTIPIKSNSDFAFLSSLLPKISFSKEKELYKKLTIEGTVDLIFEGLDSLPDMEPKGFVKSFKDESKISSDIEVMRQHIAYMLTKDVSEEKFKALIAEANESKPVSGSELIIPLTKESAKVPDSVIIMTHSSASSTSSTPCATPPLSTVAMDTDLRSLFPQLKARTAVSDVDMRVADPRLSGRSDPQMSRDPRLQRDPRVRKDEASDNRISPPPNSLNSQNKQMTCKSNIDPPTSEEAKPKDPRLPKKENTHKKSRWDPRTSREVTQTTGSKTITSSTAVLPCSPKVTNAISTSTSLPENKSVSTTQPPSLMDIRFSHPPLNRMRPDFIPSSSFGFKGPMPFPPPTHFMGPLHLPHNSMQHPPTMMNHPFPFNWNNRLQNPLIMTQNIQSQQTGILPTPTVMNM